MGQKTRREVSSHWDGLERLAPTKVRILQSVMPEGRSPSTTSFRRVGPGRATRSKNRGRDRGGQVTNGFTRGGPSMPSALQI